MSVAVEEIDRSELSSNSTLLQSAVWAAFKADFGWEAHALRPVAGPWAGEAILVLLRRLAPGLTLAYVPYGPTCPGASGVSLAGALTDLGASLAATLPVTPVCVRFDLLWEADSLEHRQPGEIAPVPGPGGAALGQTPGVLRLGRDAFRQPDQLLGRLL